MYSKTTLLLAFLISFLLPSSVASSPSSPCSLDSRISASSSHSPQYPSIPQSSWSEQLKSQLAILATEADTVHYNTGICVWDLTTDSLLFGYNNQKVMRPASTQKVLTAVSALSILGGKHEISTKAYYTGTITADSTLCGDIYVVGDFDPMYSYSDLHDLARNIKELGIKRITGKVYGDASMKNKDLYGNGWCWDDVPSSNQPYLCALMLERGKVSPSFNSYSKDLLFNPAEHFVMVLSQELRDFGVLPAESGRSMLDYAAKEMTEAGNHFYTKSRTIEQVLQRMLKNSDNYHAEALFFQLANIDAGKQCTWKDGARQIENVLRKAGVNTAYGEVADGSGVSLYNYVSPNSQVAMLRYAYQNADIYNYLYPALPIAGQDGTLSSRMQDGSAFRNVHAKTGTVEGCSCLCGYVTASNGHILAFSIMNNGLMKSKTGRDFQDRVCQELAR